MNLRKILIDVILEFKGKTYYLPKITKDDRTIEFSVSYEQNEMRSGNLDPLLPENQYSLNSMINGNWGSGVYNFWIRKVVEKNFDDVFDLVLERSDINREKNARNRIIFIGSNKYIDGIEFVTDFEVYSEDRIGLKVITSGISKVNRNFFANRDKDDSVDLIHENSKNLSRIYLAN
jgi:hypothetical protein